MKEHERYRTIVSEQATEMKLKTNHISSMNFNQHITFYQSLALKWLQGNRIDPIPATPP